MKIRINKAPKKPLSTEEEDMGSFGLGNTGNDGEVSDDGGDLTPAGFARGLGVAPAPPKLAIPKPPPKVKLPVLPAVVEEVQPQQGYLVPTLNCDQCTFNADCPENEPGMACFFADKFTIEGELSTANAIVSALEKLVQDTLRRYRMASIGETFMNQGATNPEVTRLSQVVVQQLSMLKAEKLSLQPAVRPQMTQTTRTVTVADSTPAKTGGLLSQLFGQAKTVKKSDIEINPAEKEVAVVSVSETVTEER